MAGIGIWIEYRIKAGAREAFLAAIRRNCADTLADDGCLRIEPGVSGADPDVFVPSELWRDQRSIDRHRAKPGHDASHADVDALVAEKRVVRYAVD
jgi:quinol monooxygenase YgiN